MPNQRHTTSDGIEITPGLVVLTTDLKKGVIGKGQFEKDSCLAPDGEHFDGFFEVLDPDTGGLMGLFDGERLTTDLAGVGEVNPVREPEFRVGDRVYHQGQRWAPAIAGGTAEILGIEGPRSDGSWELTVWTGPDFSRRTKWEDTSALVKKRWNSSHVRRCQPLDNA